MPNEHIDASDAVRAKKMGDSSIASHDIFNAQSMNNSSRDCMSSSPTLGYLGKI